MPRTVNSAAAALRILLYLEKQARVPAGLTRIALAAGLHKSTCHALLHTLETHEFVVREPASRGYLLGPALIGMGMMAVGNPGYVQVALKSLLVVNQSLQMACHLVQRFGPDTIQVVGRLDAPDGLSLVAQVGQRFPLDLSWATPRCFVAWAGEAEQRLAFAGLPERGIPAELGEDFVQFQAYLARVRIQGFDLTPGFEAVRGGGFAFVAAPIFDRTGQVVLVADLRPIGAQAATGHLRDYAQHLTAATRAITRAIGGTLPADYPGSDQPSSL